jgi:hypothetical protein
MSLISLFAGFIPRTEVAPTPPIVEDASAIKVQDKRGDAPAFERVYKTQISQHVSMTITIKFYWEGRDLDTSGELDQTGGRWVLFEPERPADKILDRELLPIIESKCKQILAMDRKFRATNPSEFTDANGVKWQRVK